MKYLDIGDKMFVILKGSISVHVPIPTKVVLKTGSEPKWLMSNFGTYTKYD